MNKTQIISQIANDRLVERLINTMISDPTDTGDLANDIYISLLEKPDERICSLYESGTLTFFIIRMIKNNIFSSNSPYYQKYNKWDKNRTTLDKDEFIERNNF